MAAPTIDLHRNFYRYISDDTNTYQIATLNANAAAQTTPATPIAPGVDPVYPRGWVTRKVHGVYTSGGVTYRTVVPLLDPTDAIWTGATETVTKFGQTYECEGRIGERRINRS